MEYAHHVVLLVQTVLIQHPVIHVHLDIYTLVHVLPHVLPLQQQAFKMESAHVLVVELDAQTALILLLALLVQVVCSFNKF